MNVDEGIKGGRVDLALQIWSQNLAKAISSMSVFDYKYGISTNYGYH